VIRLLLCEDDLRYRRVLRKVLQAPEDLEVVAETALGEEVCELSWQLRPHVLLLDLELPGVGGLDVITKLGETRLTTEILVLTSFADQERVFEAMRRGAAGYLVKGVSPARLEQGIREVSGGGTVIEPVLAKRFWRYFAAARGRGGEDYGLTDAEREVLVLVGRGLSNPEAAQVLGASRRSVKAQLERIYRKLGVTSRVEATVKALQNGLIEL
jgi:DNA-binding NarL/FixJ family response regulator